MFAVRAEGERCFYDCIVFFLGFIIGDDELFSGVIGYVRYTSAVGAYFERLQY